MMSNIVDQGGTVSGILYRWPGKGIVRIDVDREQDPNVSKSLPRVWLVFRVGRVVLPPFYLYRNWLGRKICMASWKGAKTFEQVTEPHPFVRKMILGLLLDLGIDRPNVYRRDLVQISEAEPLPPLVVPYPRTVPDVRWEGRYEEAKLFELTKLSRPQGKVYAQGPRKESPFLGLFEDFEIWPPEYSGSGQYTVTYTENRSGLRNDYFHGLVDQLLDHELILPESSLRAWEAEHADRGEFVLLSRDEAELYRAVGEDLPVWWPFEQLVDWMLERR